MGTVLFKFLVGAAAGLFVWMIMQPSAPRDFAQYLATDWESHFVLALGGGIGLAVGGFDGFSRGGKVNLARGAGLGLIFGGIGMSFGHGLFGNIVHSIFPIAFTTDNVAINIVPRAFAFAGMGLCLGAAIGASSLNPKKIVQGAIGGLLGGGSAGVLFDPISTVLSRALGSAGGGTEGGGPGRAAMALLLGGAIALFIGIVDRLARSAWLRLQLGRNEGKEWVIDSGQTFIGSREGIQVPIFGDPNISPIHASIQKHGGNYVLTDGGSPVGTLLNGQFIQQATLFHGAMIQIGGSSLQFLMKHGHAPARGPEPVMGQAYPLTPQQPQQQQPQPQMPQAAWQPIPTQAMPAQPMPTSQPTMAYATPLVGGASLVAIDGPLMGQRFPVSQPMEIGREGSGIPVSFDTAASRKHASAAPAPGGLAITDLGSTNGTFVNGQRVSQSFAKPGDLIKIGSTTFRVEA